MGRESARFVSASHGPRQRAEWIEDQHFAEVEPEVLRTIHRKLRAWKMRVDSSDVEEMYWQACAEVWARRIRGEPIFTLTGLLVTITWRRTIDRYLKMRPGAYADIDLALLRADGDLVERMDQEATVGKIFARMKRDLNPQELKAVYLCEVRGYSRPEARKLLHLSEVRMQRLMDGATKKIGRIAASIRARGCGEDEWARMLFAYARGDLAETSRDYRRAETHIEECECCERYVVALRLKPPDAETG